VSVPRIATSARIRSNLRFAVDPQGEFFSSLLGTPGPTTACDEFADVRLDPALSDNGGLSQRAERRADEDRST
jgi:hypothetical protein